MPFALLAVEQTAGRGRGERRWWSAAGKGVWASVALAVSDHGLQSLPMRTGVALAEVVNRAAPGACRLKWPNDLVCGGRKLGGILIEALSRSAGRRWAVIGIGIDHGHGADELPTPAATSLRLVGGEQAAGDLAAFAVECLWHLWRELGAVGSHWLDRYRALSAHAPGDPIAFGLPDGTVEGRFVGFDQHGFIELETAAGLRTLRSGEVFRW
jgi:BirA family biotin operon repressor/biotin-[acetyl-CoA-carboxylase] ligase